MDARSSAAPEEAEVTRAYLAAIIASASAAIIGKTLDGVITSWNAGAERLYGYPAAEAVGRSIAILVPPDQPDELPALLARLRRGEPIADYETDRVRKDGCRVPVLLSLSPIRDRAAQTVGAASITLDLTARRQAEAALAETARARDQALAEAQAALQVRDAFLSSISHDLRSPLAAVRGSTQLLLRRLARGQSLAPDDLQARLEDIDRATATMIGMVEDLLDLTLLEAGRPLDLVRAEVDLGVLAEQVAADYRRTAPQHRLLVQVPAPVVGWWDRPRLERVLANLVANAVKYSPAGGTVRVAVAARAAAAAAWAEVVVQDDGIGIPAADLPRVFERFYRGGNVVGHITGTGLGLAGVHALVEQHGGTVTIASREGQGTTVTVRLPLGPSPQ